MSEKKKNIWNLDKKYGDYFFDIATGKADEMFCSVSICEELKGVYEPGMRLLDAGCGGGHYLRSLRERLDAKIDYSGVDRTPYYLEKAREAFPEIADRFVEGSVDAIPFEDESFDIVMCNNLILHLPPNPLKALSELLRVSRGQVIIRTLFGGRSYVIKEIRTYGQGEEIEVPFDEQDDSNFNYFNVYEEQYFSAMIRSLHASADVRIVRDERFGNFDTGEATDNQTGTRVMNGMQVSGNILLDWRFVHIRK